MKFYLLTLFISTSAFAQLDLIDDTKTRASASVSKEAQKMGELLDRLHADCGRYPTTAEGLEALVTKPKTLDCKNWKPYAQAVPKSLKYSAKNDSQSYELK